MGVTDQSKGDAQIVEEVKIKGSTTQADAEQLVPTDELLSAWNATHINACDSSFVQKAAQWLGNLKELGVDCALPRRQIVVCGLNSSGKSSVLEAISGIAFPIKERLGTTFVTELNLKRDPVAKLKVSIRPGLSRNTVIPAELSKFAFEVETSLKDLRFPLGGLYRSAAKPIARPGVLRSDDVLVITLSAPEAVNLTLVDLPGFEYHGAMLAEMQASAGDNSDDGSAYRYRYLADPSSTILFVTPAESAISEVARYHIHGIVKSFDHDCSRTICVVTKPDRLAVGSLDESELSNLMKDEGTKLIRDDFRKLKLGWHLLHNRNNANHNTMHKDREDLEQSYFAEKQWTPIAAKRCGAESLRRQLSVVFETQMRKHLLSVLPPSRNLKIKIGQRVLSISPHSIDGRKAHLSAVCASLKSYIARRATSYATQTSEISQALKLRENVEDCKSKFHAEMESAKGSTDSFWSKNKSEYIAKVLRAMQTSTTSDFLGYPSTALPIVNRLFIRQILPWEDLAKKHCDLIVSAAMDFVSAAMKGLSNLKLAEKIHKIIMVPAFKLLQDGLHKRLDELLLPYQVGALVTMNDHYFKSTLQAVGSTWCYSNSAYESFIKSDSNRDVLKLTNLASREFEQKKDMHTCTAVVDIMMTHFKISRKDFIDSFSRDCIEMNLMRKLSNIFTVKMVSALSDSDICAIYGEVQDGTDADWHKLHKQHEGLNKAIRGVEKLLAS